MLLFDRRLDGCTHTLRVRAAVQTEVESKQTRGRGAILHGTQPWAAARPVASQPAAILELGLAPPMRGPIEDGLRRGRCGTNADSHVPPRRHPRARRVVPPPRTRLRKKCKLHMCLSGCMLRVVT